MPLISGQKVERYRNKRIRNKYNKLLEEQQQNEGRDRGMERGQEGEGGEARDKKVGTSGGKSLEDLRKIEFYNQVFGGQSSSGKTYQKKQTRPRETPAQPLQKDQDEQQQYIRKTFGTKTQKNTNKIQQEYSAQEQLDTQRPNTKIQNKNIVEYRINTGNLIKPANPPQHPNKDSTNNPIKKYANKQPINIAKYPNTNNSNASKHPQPQNSATKHNAHNKHSKNNPDRHQYPHQQMQVDRQQKLKLKAQKLKDRKNKFIKKMHTKTQRGQPVMSNYVKYALAKLEEGIVRDKINNSGVGKGRKAKNNQ